MGDMKGQVAVVTGGTRGIGLAICERLINREVTVAAGYATKHDPARELAGAPVGECGVTLSVFDMFKIGIGPSSSHTVGPMRAARTFASGLAADGLLDRVAGVRAELSGSLGATGHGHGSDKAVLLGLEGEDPETVDTDRVQQRVAQIRAEHRLRLAGKHQVDCDPDQDLVLHRRRALPCHPNGMQFCAYDTAGASCAAGCTTPSAAASWLTRTPPARTGSRPTTPRYATRSAPRPGCSATARPPGCRSAR